MSLWSPHSWKKFQAHQQPNYKAPALLDQVCETISQLPPLVSIGEVQSAQKQMADAADGRRFVLQGGDCAERFQDCNQETINHKIQILMQMSAILSLGAKKPVVRVGRIAGQYSKPRSNSFETIQGKEIPVFRGDNVNSFKPLKELREPNPERLLKGYHLSALTLNYVRALIAGGFANFQHPDHWSLPYNHGSSSDQQYKDLVKQIKEFLAFMDALEWPKPTDHIDFFTSHEGLILPYEQAMTRFDEASEQYYNLGAHMLWLGDRTRQIDGAHVEYFRGIANPIGVKIGPSISTAELLKLLEVLNPENIKGKITLITRLGSKKVCDLLPPLIQTVQSRGFKVLWSVDPMHGNAILTKNHIKTRNFNEILQEVTHTTRLHKEHSSTLNGVHFELTGEDVTECIGGMQKITQDDLSKNYETYCDPRLNGSQSLEMAFLMASILRPSE